MKVALVHDYLIDFGGAERVLIALKRIWPEAEVFVAIKDEKKMGRFWRYFSDWDIHVSWFQKLPFSTWLISPLRFLLPFIWHSFDLSDYDLVVSSSAWAMSKGVKTTRALHVCYCHTPPRFLYGYPEARGWKRYWPIKIYAKLMAYILRFWDYSSSQDVDVFVANSHLVAARIKKFYRREAVVINPPIKLPVAISRQNQDYFLFVSRLASYKHPELAIKACAKLKLFLKIAGDGPLKNQVTELSSQLDNVEYLGRVSDRKLARLFRNCRALIFPVEEEDFGMVPLEAMAWGKPVIALFSGGAKETVIEGKTGLFFKKPTVNSLVGALEKFQKKEKKFVPLKIRQEAEKRSFGNFEKALKKLIDELLAAKLNAKN